MLCDKYATTNRKKFADVSHTPSHILVYSYCPTWALNWEYRKHQLIKEICHYDADIVTLQVRSSQQNSEEHFSQTVGSTQAFCVLSPPPREFELAYNKLGAFLLALNKLCVAVLTTTWWSIQVLHRLLNHLNLGSRDGAVPRNVLAEAGRERVSAALTYFQFPFVSRLQIIGLGIPGSSRRRVARKRCVKKIANTSTDAQSSGSGTSVFRFFHIT